MVASGTPRSALWRGRATPGLRQCPQRREPIHVLVGVRARGCALWSVGARLDVLSNGCAGRGRPLMVASGAPRSALWRGRATPGLLSTAGPFDSSCFLVLREVGSPPLWSLGVRRGVL